MSKRMDDVSQKAREFVAYCHEKGLVTCVGVADKKDGLSIRAMDGQLADMMLLIATLFKQIEIQTGEKAEEVAKQVLTIISAYTKEENEWN